MTLRRKGAKFLPAAGRGATVAAGAERQRPREVAAGEPRLEPLREVVAASGHWSGRAGPGNLGSAGWRGGLVVWGRGCLAALQPVVVTLRSHSSNQVGSECEGEAKQLRVVTDRSLVLLLSTGLSTARATVAKSRKQLQSYSHLRR